MVALPEISDDALRESIRAIQFPQYHTLNGRMFPRSSGVTHLHPKSLHQKIHFGECNRHFLEGVRRLAIEGDRIHRAIKRIFTDEERRSPYLSADEQKKMDRFRAWKRGQHDMIVLWEPDKSIVSSDKEYGGTPDLVYHRKGKTTIVDYNVGNKIHEPKWQQVASYVPLLNQIGVHVDRIAILLLGENGTDTARFIETSDIQKHLDGFRRNLDKWYELFPEPFEPTLRKTG